MAQSSRFSLSGFMSAFGGKADSNHHIALRQLMTQIGRGAPASFAIAAPLFMRSFESSQTNQQGKQPVHPISGHSRRYSTVTSIRATPLLATP
jgi:hypothetical protein